MNYTDLNATHPCKWCGCQCSIFNTDRQCEQCWQARKLPIAVLQKMIVNLHPLLLDLWAAVKQRCDDASPTWAPELRDIVAKLEAMP